MIQPATPLPWRERGDGLVIGADLNWVNPKTNRPYVLHAANLYPRLVAMLHRLEWGANEDSEWLECVMCKQVGHIETAIEHKPDCELAALLKEIK